MKLCHPFLQQKLHNLLSEVLSAALSNHFMSKTIILVFVESLPVTPYHFKVSCICKNEN